MVGVLLEHHTVVFCGIVSTRRLAVHPWSESQTISSISWRLIVALASVHNSKDLEGLRFRALLSEDDAERLEFSRA
jgi:hypothetical protein